MLPSIDEVQNVETVLPEGYAVGLTILLSTAAHIYSKVSHFHGQKVTWPVIFAPLLYFPKLTPKSKAVQHDISTASCRSRVIPGSYMAEPKVIAIASPTGTSAQTDYREPG